MQLLENLEFHDNNPYAQPLLVSDTGRVLRFTLKPGQSIREHSATASPFYVVVLQGEGMFAGGDKKEQRYGPNSLVIFDPGETHSVRALDGELVFVGFLQGVPGTPPGKVTGEITQQ
jgi:quercetin dioxygenase-like cupin family protein